MLKGKTVLILGGGQIGKSCACRLLKDQPGKIILHTLTKKEATQAIKNIKTIVKPGKTKLIASWGNILLTKELMNVKRSYLLKNPYLDRVIHYYYDNLSDKLIQDSALYFVVKKWQPEFII